MAGVGKPPSLAPFRQGDLDGLCGLYAVVNALRRATRYEAPEADAWPWLFAELMQQADKLIGAATAVTYGLYTKPLWALAQHAVTLLAREYDLPITVARPLRGRRKLTLKDAFDGMANATARGGTGVLVGFGGPLDHWTVVASVTPLHLILFDSARYRRIRQDACVMEGKTPKPGRHVVVRSAVFVFTLGD